MNHSGYPASSLDLEIWDTLYALAMRIYNLAPWDTFRENDYISVEHPNIFPGDAKEMIYCAAIAKESAADESCEMSTQGKNNAAEIEDGISLSALTMKENSFFSLEARCAVAVFAGNDSLCRMERLRRRAMAGVPFPALGEQDCLVCFYGKKESISTYDLEIQSSLGIDFSDQAESMYFRSIKQNSLPEYLNKNEALLLSETLSQYIKAIEDFNNGFKADFRRGDMLVRKIKTDGLIPPDSNGETGTAKESFETVLANKKQIHFKRNKIIVQDELYLARLKQGAWELKASLISQGIPMPHGGDLEIDIISIPAPVQENKSESPYFVRVLLIADIRLGILTDEKFIYRGDNTVKVVFDTLKEVILEEYFPRSLHVRDAEMGDILEDFCRKLDIRLVYGYSMPTIDSSIAELIAKLENNYN